MDKRKTAATAKKVEKLLKTLSDKKNILIVSHDNPDPDTMASAFALGNLLSHELKATVTMGFSGIIGRAENRAMIRHLGIPLKQLSDLNIGQFDSTILVDSQPRSGRPGLPKTVEPDVVIDHHPYTPASRHVEFHDIQSSIGATSTIITQYYIAQGLEMDAAVATALLYGIKSDTRDLGRGTSTHDLDAYLYLYPRANLTLLSKIEHAEVPADYFKIYARAIDNAITYDGVVTSFLGDINNPDIVAEIADTMIRLEGAHCALVGGYYDNQIFVSFRTKETDVNAAKLVQRVIGNLGPSGGHGSMSAGRIKMNAMSDTEKEKIEQTLVRRLKRTMNLRGKRGKKLVR
jgi:nanoRNase/pAp phosphatase (c-di-AMP/oligoRNAs hydrolase)